MIRSLTGYEAEYYSLEKKAYCVEGHQVYGLKILLNVHKI